MILNLTTDAVFLNSGFYPVALLKSGSVRAINWVAFIGRVHGVFDLPCIFIFLTKLPRNFLVTSFSHIQRNLHLGCDLISFTFRASQHPHPHYLYVCLEAKRLT